MLSTVPRSTLLSASFSPMKFVRTARHFSSVVPSKTNNKNSEITDDKDGRRKIHQTTKHLADVAVPSQFLAEEEKESSYMYKRLFITAEVTISKIFPAGFGWQSASIIAENNLGYASDTMAFAAATGLGDALGVLMGHTIFYSAKKSITGDASINMTKEFQTGILLGSAAFCSGSVWQPLVDVLQGLSLSFSSVVAGTWIGCSTAFYLGLRAGRTILSGPFEYIQEPTYENSKKDTSLSVAIGGATGFFVGTDAAYLPNQNFLINVVGIHDGTPELTSAAIAGTSTALGFVTAQSALNVTFPEGKCWND